MCGIAGIIQHRTDTALAALAAPLGEAIRHRGPDDAGWLLAGPGLARGGARAGNPRPDAFPAQALLVHRRLSILDLTDAGHQPMSSPDGRFHLVFNGEIYNFLELRSQLQAKAAWTFRSNSDTEVLLAGLALEGEAILPRLKGMFAFALLDLTERTLLLARDPFGIKPLFYSADPGRLCFASELKALLAIPGASSVCDAQRVFDYLTFATVDHDHGTFWRDIRQLPPGHSLRASLNDPGHAEVRPYRGFELRPPVELGFDQAADRLRELLLGSVRIHLRSDVPVGALLSGGLDSSILVCAARHLAGPAAAPMDTFSYIADDPSVSEEKWIDIVAQAAGARPYKIRPGSENLLRDLDELIRVQEAPFPSTSIYAQFCVFRAIRERGVKVVLDGQGADELFAGYRPFLGPRVASLLRRGRFMQAAALLRRAAHMPGVRGGQLALHGAFLAARSLAGPGLNAIRRYGRQRHPWIDLDWFLQRQVAPANALDLSPPPELFRHSLLDALTRSSVPSLLRYEDRDSMAFSIESRVPFLLPEIADFALSLPDAHLIDRDGLSKAVLRRAMRGIVPDVILNRKDKIGFQTPESPWLRQSAAWVEGVLGGARARAIPALRVDGMLAYWRSAVAGRVPLDGRVWRWINLIWWAELMDARFE